MTWRVPSSLSASGEREVSVTLGILRPATGTPRAGTAGGRQPVPLRLVYTPSGEGFLMLRRSVALLVFVAIVPALVACGGGGSPSASAMSLPGTSWMLAELGGSAPAGGATATLAFGADGTATGNSGCNTFNGSVTLDGSSIDFGALATTRMACPEPGMSLETAFLGGLEGATSWRIDGGQLVLEGATEMRFDPA
jgi:heat shock protein HslJ